MGHKSATQLALQQFYKSLEPELTWRSTERDWRSHGDALKETGGHLAKQSTWWKRSRLQRARDNRRGRCGLYRTTNRQTTVAREMKHARGGGQLIIRDKIFSGRS